MVGSLGGNPVADYQVASSLQAKLMAQFQKTPQYQQAVTYYQQNIGKVTSVDGLLKNYRLLKVALDAFNLGGAINQTGLLKKLLSQDPTQKKSLAQQLIDPRYMAFAKAFWSLSQDGGASTGNPINVDSVIAKYTNYQYQIWAGQTQQDSSLRQALYTQSVVQDAVNVTNVGSLFTQFQNSGDVQQATDYYKNNIGNITTVGQFMADSKLVNFALTSFGIDPSTVSSDTLRQLLTQNPTDPSSVAQNNPAYQKFAAAFSTLSRDHGKTIQNANSVSAMITNYQTFAFENTLATGDSATLTRIFGANGANQIAVLRQSFNNESGAVQAANYYKAHIGGVTSGKDIQKDQGLLNVALLSYNLDPSNLPTSGIATAANYYKSNIGGITTVSQFEADQQLVNVALTAYGIDPATVNSVSLNRLLTENPDASTSLAQTNPQYLAFAQAFKSLNSLSGVWIHMQSNVDSVVNAYQTNAMQATIKTKLAQQQAAGILQASGYYQANIGKATTVSQFLSDPQLMNVALTAFGIDPTATSNATVQQLLTQNPADPTSLAQTSGNAGYLAFANAFSSLNTSGGSGIHTTGAIDSVLINFQKNELALESTVPPTTQQASAIANDITYYTNNIGGVTSPAALESDQRLLKVALTAYGVDPNSINIFQVDQLLTQDPTLPTSLAQTNSNYLAFANAFSTLKSDNGTTIHSQASVSAVIGNYEAAVMKPAASAMDTASAYYKANIGNVTSDAQIFGDTQQLNADLVASGLSPSTVSADTAYQLLTQDPTSQFSLARTSGNAAYLKFAQTYSVAVTGSTALIGDQQLRSTALTAFGIDPTAVTMTDFNRLLTENPTSSTSLAQSSGNAGYLKFAQTFQSLSTDGGAAIHTQTNIDTVLLNYQNASLQSATGVPAGSASPPTPLMSLFSQFQTSSATQTAVDYYKANIGNVTTVAQFMADPKLINFALQAYGIDPTTVATSDITNLLTQDPTSTKSLALQNPNYLAFAQAFASLNKDGGATIHGAASINTVVATYQNTAFMAALTTNDTKTNSQIFTPTGTRQIGMLRDDLLTTKPLDLLMTQDPNDPLSLAQQTPEFTAFAQTFAATGPSALFNLRSNSATNQVITNFENKEFRLVVGADLAQAQAANKSANKNSPTGTKTAPPLSINQVLSDPTISAVVRQAYGLPQSEAALSVPQQTKALTNAGFDPAKLIRPGAIDKLVKQFLANVALQQADSSTSATATQASMLFSGASADGDVAPIQMDLSSLISTNQDSDSTSSSLSNLNILI